jgi:hypothetical protein
MTSPDSLTLNQLAQRIDEVTSLLDVVKDEHLVKRLEELTSHFNEKSKSNFNKGVVQPLPPDHLDLDNTAVVTPKTPEQVEREYNNWVKGLET